MSLSVLFLFVALASGSPAADDGADVDRTPIRCRPAPFYVADRAERPKVERLMVTGSRVPVRTDNERRARPCMLMQAPTPVLAPGFRAAD